MRKIAYGLFCGSLFMPFIVSAQTVAFTPASITQGDPIMVTITASSSPLKLTFDGQDVPVFIYNGEKKALIAIDIAKKPGDYTLSLQLPDGITIDKTITVIERKKIEAPLGIPQKMGGNTAASQKKLVSNLSTENAVLAKIKTGTKAFWTQTFQASLAKLTVTDPYGYNRKTGEYTIAHKGTDFHAAEGTPVMAMNRGVVRIARTTGPIYGKTIIVDHGLGLQTFYMHLSKINVNEGELVLPGEVIGLSGQTGYADQPHLHLTVRINGTSIDPLKFFDFFGVKATL